MKCLCHYTMHLHHPYVCDACVAEVHAETDREADEAEAGYQALRISHGLGSTLTARDVAELETALKGKAA